MKEISEMNLRELAAIDIRGEDNIAFPLKHGAAGMVFDAKGNHVLDVRGWGRIQYHEQGSRIHDAITDAIVDALNKAYENQT